MFRLDPSRMKCMARGDVPKCKICGEKIRPRVMLYEDENGENICEDWESQLKLDVPKSDLFLWISIPFAAASLEYFREVRRILMSSSNTTVGSLPYHIIINPDKTAAENLESALCRDAALGDKRHQIAFICLLIVMIEGEARQVGVFGRRCR